MTRTLPPYDPATSDGCSIPSLVRWAIPALQTDAAKIVCRRHDEGYYFGGSWVDRLLLDVKFLVELTQEARVSQEDAIRAYHAVRGWWWPGVAAAGRVVGVRRGRVRLHGRPGREVSPVGR